VLCIRASQKPGEHTITWVSAQTRAIQADICW
jgi:hypothetical protein